MVINIEPNGVLISLDLQMETHKVNVEICHNRTDYEEIAAKIQDLKSKWEILAVCIVCFALSLA